MSGLFNSSVVLAAGVGLWWLFSSPTRVVQISLPPATEAKTGAGDDDDEDETAYSDPIITVTKFKVVNKGRGPFPLGVVVNGGGWSDVEIEAELRGMAGARRGKCRPTVTFEQNYSKYEVVHQGKRIIVEPKGRVSTGVQAISYTGSPRYVEPPTPFVDISRRLREAVNCALCCASTLISLK